MLSLFLVVTFAGVADKYRDGAGGWLIAISVKAVIAFMQLFRPTQPSILMG